MKKLLLHIVALAITGIIPVALYGQPTITYSGNAPQIGDAYDLHLVDHTNIDPGPDGANQTWDYSGLPVTGSEQTDILDPASTPNGSSFPNATLAFKFSEDSYMYGELTTSYLDNLGIASEQSGFSFVLPYSDPLRLMVFPFAFNDSYSDTYRGSYSISVSTITQTGSITSTADAWGTLITPEGSYTALRVKSVQDGVDSVFVKGVLMETNETSVTNYSWYSNGSKEPLFNISISTSGGSTDTIANYSGGPAGIREGQPELVRELDIYPVPARNQLNVALDMEQGSTLDFSVINILGQEMMQGKFTLHTGPNQKTIDISPLSEGVYYLTVKKEHYAQSMKFVKE